MHYTGTIWRPPYEADSLLLEVTAGCTHHKCKFCTLYNDLPFKFRMSPMEDMKMIYVRYKKQSKVGTVKVLTGHFSMKSYKKSARKNYKDIEKAFIIYNLKEENECTLQAELGDHRMKHIRSSYRLPLAAPIINASFAACIKMSVSECRLLRSLRRT